MQNKFDIVIIGNGILGLTLSYFLKKFSKNISVALIGDIKRKGSATLAAGAMINCWAELTNGQFENPALADKFSLTRRGWELWDDFASTISDESSVDVKLRKGTYVIRTAKSTKLEDVNLHYIKQSLQKFSINHRQVAIEDLDWLRPSQCSKTFEAIWLPDGRVDSRKVVKALDIIVANASVIVFHKNAKEIINKLCDGGGDNIVVLEDGTKIVGKNIVLANGAYAQHLIDQLNPIRNTIPRLLFGTGSGIDLIFADRGNKYGVGNDIFGLDAVVRTTDRGGACGLHLIPYDECGTFYLGASSFTTLDADVYPKLYGVSLLLHSVVDEINHSFFTSGISLRSNGFRPTCADAFPLIGETNIPGIWLLNGTKRDGFTMSPYISRELAKAILGTDFELPRRFMPCRKLISYKTKMKAINETELMYESVEYMHGGIVAPYMIESYKEMRRNNIIDIYKRREINDFGIHPELIHLYDNDDFYKRIQHPRAKEECDKDARRFCQ